MGHTIVFVEPFESQLKELKIKTKFIRELKDHIKRWDTQASKFSLRDRVYGLNCSKNWVIFIAYGFFWNETKDGYNYWVEIAAKYPRRDDV